MTSLHVVGVGAAAHGFNDHMVGAVGDARSDGGTGLHIGILGSNWDVAGVDLIAVDSHDVRQTLQHDAGLDGVLQGPATLLGFGDGDVGGR